MIKLELPYLPPAVYSSNSRTHWTARRGTKDSANKVVFNDVQFLLLESAGGERFICPWMEKAEVRVTFYLPDKQKRDHDGLVQRMKPVFDALKECGVIEDDSLEVIGWPIYNHMYRKNEPGTLIEIEEKEG